MIALAIACALAGLAAVPASAPPSPTTEGRTTPAAPAGLFVLAGRLEPRELAPLLDIEGVAGLSVTATWDQLEPRAGSIDPAALGRLERDVALAAKKGKTVTLRLLPGVATPAWVYAAGAARFHFVDRNPYHDEEHYGPDHRLHGSFGKTLAIPVPWDKVFLARWERLVGEVGRRLGGETAITLVHVTGPNKHSAEMILPRDRGDRERWRAAGYSKERLAGAWRRSIEIFAAAFPRSALALDLSPAVFKDGVVETVVAEAHTGLGRRLCLQNNILEGKGGGRREDWKLLEQYRDRVTIGFQRQPQRLKKAGGAGDAERLRQRREGFAAMLDEGIRRGARYLEIGPFDARDFPDLVADAARRLAAPAAAR